MLVHHADCALGGEKADRGVAFLACSNEGDRAAWSGYAAVAHRVVAIEAVAATAEKEAPFS
jgi:hypothetical protein